MLKALCLGFLALSLMASPASAWEVGGTLSYEAIYQLEKEELVRSRLALQTSIEEQLPIGRFYSSLWGWLISKMKTIWNLSSYILTSTPRRWIFASAAS